MSNFEIILCCALIPVAYVLIYIAGKYDVLGRLIEMLEEKAERKVDRNLVRRARSRANGKSIMRATIDAALCRGIMALEKELEQEKKDERSSCTHSYKNVIYVTPEVYDRIKNSPNSIIIEAQSEPFIELQVIGRGNEYD